jgi:spore maturation protein CgeB
MVHHLRSLLADRDLANRIRKHGLQTIQQRHTCAHRVAQLFEFYRSIEPRSSCAMEGN